MEAANDQGSVLVLELVPHNSMLQEQPHAIDLVAQCHLFRIKDIFSCAGSDTPFLGCTGPCLVLAQLQYRMHDLLHLLPGHICWNRSEVTMAW